MTSSRRPQGLKGLVLLVIMMAGVVAMVFLLGLLSRSRWPGPVHVPQATSVQALATSAEDIITAWAQAQLQATPTVRLSQLATTTGAPQTWATPLANDPAPNDAMQWEHVRGDGRLRFRLRPLADPKADAAFVLWEVVSADGKARKTGQALLQRGVDKKLQWTHM